MRPDTHPGEADVRALSRARHTIAGAVPHDWPWRPVPTRGPLSLRAPPRPGRRDVFAVPTRERRADGALARRPRRDTRQPAILGGVCDLWRHPGAPLAIDVRPSSDRGPAPSPGAESGAGEHGPVHHVQPAAGSGAVVTVRVVSSHEESTRGAQADVNPPVGCPHARVRPSDGRRHRWDPPASVRPVQGR